jgi:hypothetical protein
MQLGMLDLRGEEHTFTSRRMTGCKGGQILVGSRIWPQSSLCALSSPFSVPSSEAGVRYALIA